MIKNFVLPSNSIQTQRKQGSTQAKCFDFDSEGWCARPYCRYAHKCLKCDSAHAAVNCSNSNSSFMGSNNFRGQTPIKVALADQKIIKVFRTDNLNSHFRELTKIPIKVEAIKRVFANYPNSADKQILLDGFQYGFRVQYDGPRLPFNCKNLVYAYQYDSELEEKLAKELNLGRIYFDKCLPMGCSASCALFEKIAYFREWRLKIDQKWIRLSIFWMIIYWRENQPPKIVIKNDVSIQGGL